MASLPWIQPSQDDGEADEHWFLRFIADGVKHIHHVQEEQMAVTDQLVADVATLKTSADATAAAVDAGFAADQTAAAALQTTVDNLNAQIATLTADAADPAVLAQLDADVVAITAVITAITPPPAPAPAPAPAP